MTVDLTGKVFIITGASSGIGAATAVAAAREGMNIALAARRADRLEQVAEQVRQHGGEPLIVPTDVTDDAQVRDMVDRTVERFGRIDALFANAGFGAMHPLAEPDPGDPGIQRRMWDVNYFGALRCIRTAVPVMKRQGGGRVLVCSSIAGHTGLPYYGTYAATKAAQHVMLTSLALELEPDRIHVTGVYPIGTKTEFFQVAAAENGRDALEQNTPAVLQQTSEHVARRVVQCLRRRTPPPEIWPSRPSHLVAALWSLFPRFRRFCFRFHARNCRRVMEEKPEALHI